MYRIITIERQYASGGSEIGKCLSRELGWKLYDSNILTMAAARLDIPPAYMASLEETGPGSILLNLSRTVLGGSSRKESDMPLAERLFLTERDIVTELVEQENCIIIGRAAGFLLREREDCLRVFIHAERGHRIRRAIEREGCSIQDADAVLRKNDRRRQSFYEYHTAEKWGSPESFDLCLDSSRLGTGRCVDMILTGIHAQ